MGELLPYLRRRFVAARAAFRDAPRIDPGRFSEDFKKLTAMLEVEPVDLAG